MVKSLSFHFSNKNKLFSFCHWDIVIDSIFDEVASDPDVFLIVFCPIKLYHLRHSVDPPYTPKSSPVSTNSVVPTPPTALLSDFLFL